MVYFDARLSQHHPTIEVRIADVCQHADDAVLHRRAGPGAGGNRGPRLAGGTAGPAGAYRAAALAAWRASRSGLDDVLIDPVTFRPDKAAAVTGLLPSTSATR